MWQTYSYTIKRVLLVWRKNIEKAALSYFGFLCARTRACASLECAQTVKHQIECAV
jgi:hypothetical protein